MNTVTLTMAFIMGLTGSLHCAGMCGPIIWIMPFQMIKGFKKWLAIGLYHFGRINIYALFGLTLHSFKSLFHPAWQQYISIGLGISLLATGAMTFFSGRQFNLPWTGFIKNNIGKFMSAPGLSHLFLAGILNGLLPCGLVYMALSMTVTAGTPLMSMVLMYAFGLGTMPMLIGLTIVRSKALLGRFTNARRYVPVVMLVLGCLFVVRGMNLGVPYLSPKVAIEHNEIKSSCCHK